MYLRTSLKQNAPKRAKTKKDERTGPAQCRWHCAGILFEAENIMWIWGKHKEMVVNFVKQSLIKVFWYNFIIDIKRNGGIVNIPAPIFILCLLLLYNCT